MHGTKHHRRAAIGLATLLTVAGLAFAACGDDDDDGDTTPTGGGTTPAATRAATTAQPVAPTTGGTAVTATPAADGASVVLIGATSAQGDVLTDADGLTLYTFTNDTVDSGASTCNEGCATAWPPLTITGEPTGPDSLTGELDVITRTDGASQVTYNGAPLYRFANDTIAGDTNGHEVGGVWFVAKP